MHLQFLANAVTENAKQPYKKNLYFAKETAKETHILQKRLANEPRTRDLYFAKKTYILANTVTENV